MSEDHCQGDAQRRAARPDWHDNGSALMKSITDWTDTDVEAHLERYEREARDELAASAVTDPARVQRMVNALTVRERRKISLMQTRGISALAADELLMKDGYVVPLEGRVRSGWVRPMLRSAGTATPSIVRRSAADRDGEEDEPADSDLARIQQRFRAVRRRVDRPRRWRTLARRLLSWWPTVSVMAIAAFVAHALLASQPWPAMTSLKHFAAFPNCSMARLVGLAPAARGRPGYWPQHDADLDGWACEAVPRR